MMESETCIEILSTYIAERPESWNEDIGELELKAD